MSGKRKKAVTGISFKEGLLSAQAYSKLTDNIKEILIMRGKSH
jgi:hypothetical protein